MKDLSVAIIVFTYGRLNHTIVTLESLANNSDFENFPVIIYSDGPKLGHEEKVLSVRNYLKKFKKSLKNVKVIERKDNLGLEKSIITGITDVLRDYESVIVIEDDIRTSPSFLIFMEEILNLYKDENRIGCVTGYNHRVELMRIPDKYGYDIYFAPRTCSWGWATWRNRWEDVDWEIGDIDNFIENKEEQKKFNEGGKDLSKMLIKQVKQGIDTWDIQWAYHNFKKGRLTVYPTVSYVENIGMDGTGVHCGKTSGFENDCLNSNTKIKHPKEVILDKEISKNFQKAQSLTLKMYAELIFDKGVKILKSILKK